MAGVFVARDGLTTPHRGLATLGLHAAASQTCDARAPAAVCTEWESAAHELHPLHLLPARNFHWRHSSMHVSGLLGA